MEIQAAQREVRSVFLGGSVGQAVSGIIWLISSALSTWAGIRYGILALVLGGMLIFPLTTLSLKILGHPAGLPRENPFNSLAQQIAFIVPLLMPLVGAAALYKLNWFYPAFMLIVGAHYLPFVTLYGMRPYAVLSAVLIVAGLLIGIYLPPIFTLGGWFTAGVLLLFALVVWIVGFHKK